MDEVKSASRRCQKAESKHYNTSDAQATQFYWEGFMRPNQIADIERSWIEYSRESKSLNQYEKNREK